MFRRIIHEQKPLKFILWRQVTEKKVARRCLSYIGPLDYTGKSVFVKPNFNTADICPGSTHNDTLETLLAALKAAGPRTLTVGDRSGPADAADVFRDKGIPAMCARYGAGLVNFETLKPEEWVTLDREDLHWPGRPRIPQGCARRRRRRGHLLPQDARFRRRVQHVPEAGRRLCPEGFPQAAPVAAYAQDDRRGESRLHA